MEPSELEKRVRDEVVSALDRWARCDPRSAPPIAMSEVVHPLVARIVELEEDRRTMEVNVEEYLGRVRAALGAEPGETALDAARRVMARVKDLEDRGRQEVANRVHAEQLHAAAEGIIRDKDEKIQALESAARHADRVIADIENKLARKEADLERAAFTIGRQQATIADLETSILTLTRFVGRSGRS